VSKRWIARRSLVALLVMFSAAITPLASGETSPIPAGVQLLLFSKIWMFDRSIAEKDPIVMAVLFQSSFRASAEAKDQLLRAVRVEGGRIRCVPVPLDDVKHVAQKLEQVEADVFYLTEMRGIDIREVVRVSRARDIKTVTVVAGYVDAGVAIGLLVRNDKPAIIVNRSAAEAEGSDLTAQLLRSATIITEPAAR